MYIKRPLRSRHQSPSPASKLKNTFFSRANRDRSTLNEGGSAAFFRVTERFFGAAFHRSPFAALEPPCMLAAAPFVDADSDESMGIRAGIVAEGEIPVAKDALAEDALAKHALARAGFGGGERSAGKGTFSLTKRSGPPRLAAATNGVSRSMK